MDKQPDRLILVLGGGGVRGTYSNCIMQELTASCVADGVTPRIASRFDLIVGVSIGAIIGATVIFGLFEDPGANTDMALTKLVHEAFSDHNDLAPLLQPTYKGAAKKRVLHKIFGTLTMGDVVKHTGGKTHFTIVTSTHDGRLRLITSFRGDDHHITHRRRSRCLLSCTHHVSPCTTCA